MQHAKWHQLLYAIAFGMMLGGWLFQPPPTLQLLDCPPCSCADLDAGAP